MIPEGDISVLIGISRVDEGPLAIKKAFGKLVVVGAGNMFAIKIPEFLESYKPIRSPDRICINDRLRNGALPDVIIAGQQWMRIEVGHLIYDDSLFA